MIKECRFCNVEYKTGRRNSYCCRNETCQATRRQEWQKINKPSTAFKPRTCRFCRHEFVIRHQNANRRTYCYKPKCELKQKKRYDEERRALTKEWRKNHRGIDCKDKKPCKGQLAECKRWIDNENVFFCSVCHPKMEHRDDFRETKAIRE